jgi:hypothetical protein
LFAQIAKSGAKRKQMSTSLVGTGRTTGQMRGVMARLALAASQIAAAYERYGPDHPWGFADPIGWRCSASVPPRVGELPGRPGALNATQKNSLEVQP